MKNIFFDCEFTGLRQDTELISIGFITDDGKTFYAEFNDFDLSRCSFEDRQFLRKNVISNLRFSPPGPGGDEYGLRKGGTREISLRGNSHEISEGLADWFQKLCGNYPVNNEQPQEIVEPKIQLWSDCLAYDWVLFCQLWGGAFGVPKIIHYIPMDLCTLFQVRGLDPDINRIEFAGGGGVQHNALEDARVIKACYEKLQKNLSASEALWGFIGWLTSRKSAVTFSEKHEVPIAVELVSAFCKENNLPEPKEGWDKKLIRPRK